MADQASKTWLHDRLGLAITTKRPAAANLDAQAAVQVLERFRDLPSSAERPLLILTHDRKVRTVADRVVRIRDCAIMN